MTITILTPGILPLPDLFKGTCRRCGCTAEFTFADCAATIPSQGRPDTSIKCPTEGCSEYIQASTILPTP